MRQTPPLVKICGITRSEDALAFDEKVDYLGFNFWPGSKRYIDPAAAAPIIARLRHAIPVGVFVNHTAEEINAIAAQTGIRWAQLHGSEGWDVLDGVALPVIKAIPHHRIEDLGGLRAEWDEHPDKQPRFFLVDTQSGSTFGGTGAVFDWNLLGASGEERVTSPLPRPYFLAGGIGPHNLADAVRVAHPYAVDLNSKVEASPGVKDAGLVTACIDILRAD